MKLSFKNVLPILLVFTLLILLTGCFITPSDEQPGYTPGTITGIIAATCCSTSADPVPDPCCIAPEYWCYYCENTWSLQDGVEVVLTYGEDEVATTTTNEDGEYIFTNVPPGKNYVITALCPDYNDDRPLVKDVALKVVEGETFDAKITDCVSTALGLVVDYLVEFTVLTPEEIVLDGVIAGIPYFYAFPEFKKLVLRICEISTGCVNLFEDEKVMDYLCRAAEEVGQIVLPDIDLGCTPGYAPVGGEGEGECAVPIADAGGPYSDTVCPGTENKGILPVALIDLVGSGTGTGTLSYAWDLDDDGLFDDSAEQNPQDVSFSAGSHTVVLQVTDNCGNTTDTATVTITESAAVTADAGSDQEEEVCSGTDALIDLVGSGTGTGTLSYAWDLDDDGLFDDSALQNPQDVPFGATGSPHTVTLQVTDACGSAIDEMIVTITESINHAPVIDNLPPTVQKVNIWQTYTYDVNATDTDGDNLTYTLTTKPNGMTINSSNGEITWTNANCGGLLDRRSGGKSVGNRCHKLCDINVTVRVTDDSYCGPLFDEESFIVEVWQP
jgi:PKD repeat protein